MSFQGRSFLLVVISLVFAGAAFGQMGSFGHNVADMKFTTIPPLPTCATGSVQNGDPSSGPSFIHARAQSGCTIPWHWHTPNEHLVIVSGVARIDMKDAKSVILRPGGFAKLESKHVHKFHCVSTCQFYVYSDMAFDLHYVDKAGTEITPADALKAVKETVATSMK